MNALKTSLKIQDCLLPSLDLNRAMVRMLKGKLLISNFVHNPQRAWLKISILFINTFFVCCRLYRCAHSTTETAHFTSSPRWNGGFINETAICEALTNLSQCEAETECKEMAKGILYTTASVREIFYSTLLNENENFSS